MAIPLVVWGIIEITAAAITIYELGEVSKELYDGFKKFNGDIDKAKEEIRKLIKSLEDEIAKNVDEKQEVSLLLASTRTDPQSQMTREAKGRGADGGVITGAIQQKIPFRKVISMVSEKADHMPILQLRRKKGVQIKDLPKAKRKALEELLAMSVEQLADVDLEEFLVIRLKQLAANFMFEFIDECLEWRSPLKCEVNFGSGPGYADPPVENTTRLHRKGKINPFYPSPYQYQTGSISADLMISEYRRQRPDKNNIFALVEIKFPGDRIEKEQFKAYHKLLEKAALTKTAASRVSYKGKSVTSGGRLSLFRYPEDKAAQSSETDKENNRKKTNRGNRRHKPGH